MSMNESLKLGFPPLYRHDCKAANGKYRIFMEGLLIVSSIHAEQLTTINPFMVYFGVVVEEQPTDL